MKCLLFLIALAVWLQVHSCAYNTINNSGRPELCNLLEGYPQNSDSLKRLPVRDLIVLQKCGLEYHPHYLFGSEIAMSEEYPVPEILQSLRNADDDEFRFELIEILIQVAQDDKHGAIIKNDRAIVLPAIDKAIDEMKDDDFRKLGRQERRKLALILR